MEQSKELYTAVRIAQAASGDQDAIAALYEGAYQKAYMEARSLVSDEDTALDIVQDSFVKAFRSLNQLQAPEKFPSWVAAITRNKGLDYLKKKKPILFSEMENEDGEMVEFEDVNPENLPEVVLDRQETQHLLAEILGSLSDEQRIALTMHYYEDRSIEEIADFFGCSQNTVKSRLNYGRKNVERKVKDLEKQGVKLYSLAPMFFLLWLFRMDAESVHPSYRVLGKVLRGESSSLSAPGAGRSAYGNGKEREVRTEYQRPREKPARPTAANAPKAAHTAAKTAAAGTGKAVTVKVLASVLAVALVGTGTLMAGKTMGRREENRQTPGISAQADTENNKSNTLVLTPDGLTASQETEQPLSNAHSEERENRGQNSEHSSEKTEVSQSPESAYESICARFQTAMEAEDYEENPSAYLDFNPVVLADYHGNRMPDRNFYRTEYDLDGNGTKELIIGYGAKENPQPAALYGFDGEKAVGLVKDELLVFASHLYLYDDGTMLLTDGLTGESTLYALKGDRLEAASDSSENQIASFIWTALGEERTADSVPDSSAEDAAFQELIAYYQELAGLDHHAYIEGQYNDRAYSDDLYEYHAYALDPSELDETFFDTSRIHRISLYYSYTDLDGDGQKEVAIGSKDGDGPAMLLRIFYFDGSKMQPLWGDVETGRYLQDGTIVVNAGVEVARVQRLQNSRPTDVENGDISLGAMADYGAYENALAGHGGDKKDFPWETLLAAPQN